MKVEEISRSDKAVEECDGKGGFKIQIDGVDVFTALDGEPEDGNLCRDFNDCYAVPNLLKLMYKQGKENKEVEFVKSESDDI